MKWIVGLVVAAVMVAAPFVASAAGAKFYATVNEVVVDGPEAGTLIEMDLTADSARTRGSEVVWDLRDSKFATVTILFRNQADKKLFKADKRYRVRLQFGRAGSGQEILGFFDSIVKSY